MKFKNFYEAMAMIYLFAFYFSYVLIFVTAYAAESKGTIVLIDSMGEANFELIFLVLPSIPLVLYFFKTYIEKKAEEDDEIGNRGEL